MKYLNLKRFYSRSFLLAFIIAAAQYMQKHKLQQHLQAGSNWCKPQVVVVKGAADIINTFLKNIRMMGQLRQLIICLAQ